MRLLLIRHGQTTSNVGRHLDTAAPGAKLTELGHAQAEAAAAAVLADLGRHGVDAVYASTLTRAQQTAAPVGRAFGLPLQIRAGLAEISAGDWEMATDLESIEGYVETVFSWPADLDRRVPGGESGREVLGRFDAVVEEVWRAGHGTAALVSHGAILRVWTGARARNIDTAYAATHWVPNTAMIVVVGDPGAGWTMTSWGEHALGGPHLTDAWHVGPAGEPEGDHDAQAELDEQDELDEQRERDAG